MHAAKGAFKFSGSSVRAGKPAHLKLSGTVVY
jgi:hypothetical protein